MISGALALRAACLMHILWSSLKEDEQKRR
jgi:hypothetical protein